MADKACGTRSSRYNSFLNQKANKCVRDTLFSKEYSCNMTKGSFARVRWLSFRNKRVKQYKSSTIPAVINADRSGNILTWLMENTLNEWEFALECGCLDLNHGWISSPFLVITSYNSKPDKITGHSTANTYDRIRQTVQNHSVDLLTSLDIFYPGITRPNKYISCE